MQLNILKFFFFHIIAEERERKTGKVGSKGGREKEETGDVRVRAVRNVNLSGVH